MKHFTGAKTTKDNEVLIYSNPVRKRCEKNSVVDLCQCRSESGSSLLSQCGSKLGSREPNECGSMRIRILVRLKTKNIEFL
jgi:hypothetical protein